MKIGAIGKQNSRRNTNWIDFYCLFFYLFIYFLFWWRRCSLSRCSTDAFRRLTETDLDSVLLIDCLCLNINRIKYGEWSRRWWRLTGFSCLFFLVRFLSHIVCVCLCHATGYRSRCPSQSMQPDRFRSKQCVFVTSVFV